MGVALRLRGQSDLVNFNFFFSDEGQGQDSGNVGFRHYLSVSVLDRESMGYGGTVQ